MNVFGLKKHATADPELVPCTSSAPPHDPLADFAAHVPLQPLADQRLRSRHPSSREMMLTTDDDTGTDVVTLDSSAESVPLPGATAGKTYMSAEQRARWRTRYAKRLRRSIHKQTPVVEEVEIDGVHREQNKSFGKRTFRQHSSGHYDEDEDEDEDDTYDDDVDDIDIIYRMLCDPNVTEPELFAQLPRPSRIVPDIHLGQRTDAGMTASQRKAHIRRIQATTLRVDNYDAQGMLMFISGTTRQQYGLEQYSADLVPPPGDLAVKIQRVPRKLLSHYYRGKLLVRRFHTSNPRSMGLSKKNSIKPTRAKLQSPFKKVKHNADYENQSHVKNSEASDGDIHDFEYWCPSPVFYEEERRRTQERKKYLHEVEKLKAEKRARSELGEVPKTARKRLKSLASDDLEEINKKSNAQIVQQLLQSESDDDGDQESIPQPSSPSLELWPETGNKSSNTSLVDRQAHNQPYKYDEDDNEDDDDENDVRDARAVLGSLHSKSKLMSSRLKPQSKPEEVPLFDDLFKTLKQNPFEITNIGLTTSAVKEEQNVYDGDEKDIISAPKPHINDDVDDDKEEQCNATKNDTKSEPKIDGRDGIPGFDPAHSMRGYQKEQWLANAFSKSLSLKSKSNAMHRSDDKEKTLQQRHAEQNGRTDVKAEPEIQVSDRGWNLMMKMGFKGRLGLHEDGIAEPVPMSQRLKGSNKEGVGVARRLPTPAKEKSTNVAINAAKAMSSVAAQRDPTDELRLRSEEKRRKRLAKKSKPKENARDREDDPNADLNYEFETDDGDSDNAFDNGRRGVVVDFNLLITNARSRQSEVLRQLKLAFFDADNVHIDQILKQHAYDFCDMPLIQALLEHMGATEDEDARQMLYDWLDQTFESCEKPELNSVMINTLRQWSRRSRVYIGILHRGSYKRGLRETNALGIDDLMSNMSLGSVNSEETWPYVKSTRLVLCRMGVRPPQALFITKQLSGDNKLSAGGIAGYILGARTLSVSVVAPGKIEPDICCMELVSNATVTDKLDDAAKINVVALGELFENSDGIIKHLRSTGLHKRKKSARVLALRSGDQQYHCGVIEYGQLDDEHGESLVRFYSHGEREWISNSVMDGTNRRAYRILRKSNFPSLLAPEDVEALDI